MRKIKETVCAFLLLFCAVKAHSQQIVPGSKTIIESPENNLTVQFYQKTAINNTRVMHYSVTFKGKPVILESVLDIQLDNHLWDEAMGLKVDKHARWCENPAVRKITTSSKDTTCMPICGEKKQYPR